MELKKIHIKNFRSIKDEVIEFNHNCLILIGKNEAGKSNILKAVAAVFDQYKVSDKDKRKRIANEKIDEYFVRAIYALSITDIEKIQAKFLKKFTGVNLIEFKNKKKLSDYISTVFKDVLIKISIANGQKPQILYWRFDNTDFDLEYQLYVIDNTLSPLSDGDKFNIQTELFIIVKELFYEYNFTCHYWQYNDNFLLPNSINIDDFISDPKSIKGLENLFLLCKRDNIAQEFMEAFLQDGDYANLLEQVSSEVTTTFQKIWSDFKGTSIQLQPNGEELLIKIVNKAKYSFEDRSDGFKKFISILLMLSTQARANKIKENDIIIIDEPDQSLYPTSAQYLKDELLNISKKAKVLYATHSQYMIDPSCIDRHRVVEKVDDITTIRKEDRNSPFSNDELLRRALGSSIFECLQPINIIFEGWLDKELFIKYCTFSKITKEFKGYGSVYLGGISGVETLVQLLILANKKFVIVSDSDQTSNNKKCEFLKNYSGYKKSWVSYSDICSSISTMEDFIKTDHLASVLKKNGYENYVYDVKKTAIENIEKAVKNDKEEKQRIKNRLIATLPKEKIKQEYTTFVEKLKEKLEEI
jgi:predicted ATP-binding protein involved in virulence